MASLEELKRKREQLTARIEQAEARKKQEERKLETKIKLLVGATMLNYIKTTGKNKDFIITQLVNYLTRPSDIKAVLGENKRGSETFIKLITNSAEVTSKSNTKKHDDEEYILPINESSDKNTSSNKKVNQHESI